MSRHILNLDSVEVHPMPPAFVELRYLALSTKLSPDIAELPDSGKYRVFDDGTNAEGLPSGFQAIGRQGESVDYWEGE